ncbi:MAG: ComF family protein [Candidatus Cloacimonetes bacterium]|nr:ComF family protein [Candidatus Cloacimonadota bacterium]
MNFIKDFCPVCGSPDSGNSCQLCSTGRFYFDGARSLFPYSMVVQNLLHNLKYNDFTGCARYLSKFIGNYLNEIEPFEDVDIITPVPLHKVKQRARGYNQSLLLACEVARWLPRPVIKDLIKRTRFTGTQTRLNRSERQQNVRNAFSLNPKYSLEQKNILLIDDVFTTGATVNSISNLLKDNGINRIYVLTIARA